MRKTHQFRPAPRRSVLMAMAVLTAGVLSISNTASAQAPGQHGSGMPGGGQMMQGGGPGMQGGTDGATPRMSRHVDRFMMLYDLNGDGKVTIEEINNDQARMFTAMDVDGDKSMSVEEIRRRGRTLQVFRTTTLFDLLDANGDGKLSLDEVQAPSKRWFKRYDANGDGAMDTSEVPARGRHRGPSGRGRR